MKTVQQLGPKPVHQRVSKPCHENDIAPSASTCVFVYMRDCVDVCIYIYIHLFVYVYVCLHAVSKCRLAPRDGHRVYTAFNCVLDKSLKGAYSMAVWRTPVGTGRV